MVKWLNFFNYCDILYILYMLLVGERSAIRKRVFRKDK